MLQEVLDLQNKAVNELLNKVEQSNGLYEITFKAPTGSGKTFMMAKFMDEYLQRHQEVVFIVSSLSKAKLAEQNYNKFSEYVDKGFVKNINPFLINSEDSGENALYIPIDCNVYSLPKDLYKAKSKLKDRKTLERFFKELKNQHKSIFLIKDESHLATSNLDELVKKSFFDKIINISATIKSHKQIDVEISEIEAENAKLIKSVVYNQISPSSDNEFTVNCIQYQELDRALDFFLKKKRQYNTLNINPCFIIQISNKDLGYQQFNSIRHLLQTPKYVNNLKWMSVANNPSLCETNDTLIKANPSKWEKYVIGNTSEIDVIIFKMKITEGWDIPRACMLFQIRDSKSKQLDEQVLGRIRRNPRLLDFEKLDSASQDLITKAYVWGIKPDDNKNKNISVKLKDLSDPNNVVETQYIENEIKIITTRLKDNLSTITNNFNVSSFIKSLPPKQGCKSIFELYDDLTHTDVKTQEECWKYTENNSNSSAFSNKYSDWYNYTNNISAIKNQIKSVLQNYGNSIEVVKDNNNNPRTVSFPLESSYIQNKNFQYQIGNWIWLNDDPYNGFSFDSDAEMNWLHTIITKGANKIKKVNNVMLIGKNFIPNSEIRYQYYNDGLHYSYPDFIMKTVKDEYFLFEVKSLNTSNKQHMDDEEYKNKINLLKNFYLEVSKVLRDYYFCLPILVGSTWNIEFYHNGKTNTCGVTDFINKVM